MEIINVKFTKEMISNLSTFLDRVKFNGLTEVTAINQITSAIIEAQVAQSKKEDEE